MAQEYTIPKCLWESLDAVLYSKGVSLAKEVAKELGLPSQPLIAILNKEERAKFTVVQDDEANTYQCPFIIQTGSTLMRCRCATLGLVTNLCVTHERQKHVIETPLNLPLVQRIVAPEATYMAKDSIVYTLNGTQCGIIKGSRLTLFDIDQVT
jgi:hypothetical protein